MIKEKIEWQDKFGANGGKFDAKNAGKNPIEFLKDVNFRKSVQTAFKV